MEQDLLIERIQAGLARAKSEGKTLGRPIKDNACTAVGDRRAIPGRRKRQRASQGVRRLAGKHPWNRRAMSIGVAPTPAGSAARIEPWHERLLRYGNLVNERIFMQAEIDDLRAALASQAEQAGLSNAQVAAQHASWPTEPPTATARRDAFPISVALWDIKEIAMYLRRSINWVRSDIVSLLTFPRQFGFQCTTSRKRCTRRVRSSRGPRVTRHNRATRSSPAIPELKLKKEK
jgi:hypothetical protein